ncbi:MAG: hypothetical protein JWQ49_97 [Edaphobacter sp.]|nr:hypothetical protein [Edaphobacter sp.]
MKMTPTTRLILLTIRDRSDNPPTVEELCTLSDTSMAYMLRVLSNLENEGHIIRTRTRRISRYTLAAPIPA